MFEQNPGGAPANLLTVASHIGLSHRIYRKSWKRYAWCIFEEDTGNEGINTDVSNLIEDPMIILRHWHLWQSMKMVNENFPFARKPGADTQLRADELDQRTFAKL